VPDFKEISCFSTVSHKSLPV